MPVIENICLNFVFAASYTEVDFDAALTAIDYLGDLEYTRRSALSAAAQQLDITEDNWEIVLASSPGARKWVQGMLEKDSEVETLYANLFLDVRIWVCGLAVRTQLHYN